MHMKTSCSSDLVIWRIWIRVEETGKKGSRRRKRKGGGRGEGEEDERETAASEATGIKKEERWEGYFFTAI